MTTKGDVQCLRSLNLSDLCIISNLKASLVVLCILMELCCYFVAMHLTHTDSLVFLMNAIFSDILQHYTTPVVWCSPQSKCHHIHHGHIHHLVMQ